MVRKLLVEGYRPSGKEVSVERGYQPPAGSNAKPAEPPKPPRATSVIIKPKNTG